MPNAFFVLSLKRNRSTSTCRTTHSGEPMSKISRLKSGFSIFSKCTSTNQNQQDEPKKKTNNNNNNNTTNSSFKDFFNYYFRSNDDTVHNTTSRLRRKNTYESDKNFELNHYRRKKKASLHAERNVYTLPTPKKLKSILIKHNPSRSALTTFLVAETSIPIRYSNDNSKTTHSEDLTAQEFADIAGIRILSEEEEDLQQQQYHSSEDSIMHTMSSQTPSFFNSHHHSSNSIDDPHVLTVKSHLSRSSRESQQPKIWDNEFWLNPEEGTIGSVSRNNSTQRRRETMLEPVLESGPSTVEPPILHELRRMGTCGSDKSGVIKKGRFEIHLDTANGPDQLPPKRASVLEWKRTKKNQSNSPIII